MASMLAFTRFYGLTRPPRDDDVRISISAPSSLTIWQDLADPPGASSIFDASSTDLLNERLSVPQITRMDLGFMYWMADLKPSYFPLEYAHWPRVRELRIELPLLRSDHEQDVRDFGRKSLLFSKATKISLAYVDEEEDGDLSWPEKYTTLPAEIFDQCSKEQLEIPRECLALFGEAIESNDTSEDVEELFSREIGHRSIGAVERVTPPLSPISPPQQEHSTSPEVLPDFTLFSEHTSPTLAAATALEARLFEADQPVIDSDDFFETAEESKFDTLMLGHLEEDQSLTPNALKTAEPRVEEPVTPLACKNNDHFDQVYGDVQPVVEQLLGQGPKEADHSDDDFDAFFNGVVGPRANQAIDEMKNEQLQEDDTMLRVVVPRLDISSTKAPRDEDQDKSEQATEVDVVTAILSKTKLRHWPVSRIERELAWSPFPPELGKMQQQEQINFQGSLDKLAAESPTAERFGIDALTWKPDGVRNLDLFENGDSDVEFVVPETNDSISILLRKRKRELFDDNSPANLAEPRTSALDMGQSAEHGGEVQASAHGGHQMTRLSTKKLRTVPKETMHGAVFSASNELDRFVALQTGIPLRSDKTLASEHEVEQYTLDTAPDGRSIDGKAADRPLPSLAEQSRVSSPTKTTATPAPGHAMERRAQPVVVSCSVLAHRRHLVKHMMTANPFLELIERDFDGTSLAIAGTAIPSKDNRQEVSEEADFAISPGVGIILTTMQKIRQRPLPGSDAVQSPIQKRIVAVAPRYERLLVLVSDGQPSAETTQVKAEDTQPDCDALADIASFTCSLEDEVRTSYVPGGDERLAEWIVGLVSAFGVSEDTKLLQDETLWELFLRRAGMNPFAAQVVLSELKAPSKDDESSIPGRADVSSTLDTSDSMQDVQTSPAPAFGLSAFVQMPLRQKYQRFESLFGGRKLLHDVSIALDAEWCSM